MRHAIIVLAAILALPCAAWGEDLPPPQVIKRTRGGSPDAPRPTPATPRATLPTPAPMDRPAPQPFAGAAAAAGPSSDALSSHLQGTTSIATPSQPPLMQPAPQPTSQSQIERRVDDYLRYDAPLVSPTSAPGVAGYDQGFWIRTGGFLLRTNLVLQARYEGFLFDGPTTSSAGDLSGFSLPRAVLRFSGRAEPTFAYFLELDFGSNGGAHAWEVFRGCFGCANPNLGPDSQNQAFDPLKEAWIEWNAARAFNVRAGLVGTPATRQLLVKPEFQQFADIGLGTAWTGLGMAGYSDRNRDYGVLLHGALGDRGEFGWMLSVTNGDGGDHVRNVIDQRTSDNLAYAARLNWAFLAPTGYQEAALRRQTGAWHGEVGAWAYYYADRLDMPHNTQGDYLRVGVDAALGYGPWSFTGALTLTDDKDVLGTNDDDSTAWLVQLGHHFVGTAWEVAARWSGYDTAGDITGQAKAEEFTLGVNYYLNGHGNKLQVDATWIDTDTTGFLILEPYAGYPGFLGAGDSAWLFRFQWQLAL